MPAVSYYNTAVAVKGATPPSHILSPDDKARILAYWTYENFYHNAPEAYVATLRDADGEDLSRRYIPSARTLVEATNRYLGKGLSWVLPASDELPPGVTPPTEELQSAALAALNSLFARERFGSKYASFKRWMLVRGDAALHVTADPSKPEGSKISITELDPATLFLIHDPTNSERVTGCYIVRIIDVSEQTQVAERLEYQRILTPNDSARFGAPIGTLWTRMTFWEPDGWDDRTEAGFTEEDLKPAAPGDYPAYASDPAVQPLLQGVQLPAQITSIPVYHFPNPGKSNSPFGISELQGLETLLAGITQTASDEDLTVVLQGIGVYWTDSGKPRNEDGTAGEWTISPAAMLELEAGSKVGRVDGATNIESLLQHKMMMEKAAQESSGTPDVAVGNVDVQIAESGVALALRFAPILSKNAEKETELAERMDQLLYDLLNGWLPAYEGQSFPGVFVTTSFDSPMPIDRKATLEEILALVTAKIISLEYARILVNDRLGYQIPDGMLAEIANEQTQLLDGGAARLDAAIAGGATDGAPVS